MPSTASGSRPASSASWRRAWRTTSAAFALRSAMKCPPLPELTTGLEPLEQDLDAFGHVVLVEFAGVMRRLELSEFPHDPLLVVELHLGLVGDDLGQPRHAPHGGERQRQ